MPQACLARVDVVRSGDLKEAERADALNVRTGKFAAKRTTCAFVSIAAGVAASDH
jgi:hypothetical protein